MAVTRIIVGIIAITLLCAWAHYSCPYPDLSEVFADPQKYANKKIAVFIEAKVKELTPDGFILEQCGQRLWVHTSNKNTPLNEFVAVSGTFQPPAHLYAEAVRVAEGRRWKMAVSVIPVVTLVILLPLALRFDRRTRALNLR